MPTEVQHWLRLRDSADSELRSSVDQQIVATAHRVLGDFRRKPLLSLPPPHKARGAIDLGTVLYEKEKWPAGISEAELLQNLAIFGRSGAGKTNVAFHVLRQLADRKIPFLFLDWKRTGRHLLPKLKQQVKVYTPGRSVSPFPFNPFSVPPGLEWLAYGNHVIDALGDAYTLGEGARSLLQKAWASLHQQEKSSISVADLIEQLEGMPARQRSQGWKISALRALESLEAAMMSGHDKGVQEDFAEELLQQNTIVELEALSQSSKRFLIPILCLWLYYVKLASREREKLSLVILLEEAHHVLHGHQHAYRESVMEMLLRQCRELGIGIIVVDQHPHLISSAALGNTYTSICLNLKDPRDINKAAGLSQIDDADKSCFSQLSVGQAVVKLQNRWHRPFLVQCPLVDVRKGVVGNGMLARLMKNSSGSGKRSLMDRGFAGVRRGRDCDWPLASLDDGLRFMEDVISHPDAGVKERYSRLGLSVDKGNRLKEELVDSKWLEAALVPVGRSRKVVLRPTKKAREELGIGDGSPRESLAHEYWKRFYARRFKSRGYAVELEAPRQDGRVDILATKAGERVGIEVETGKSDAVGNVKECLRSGFQKVVVVATDRAAFASVEQSLGKAGLLIPGRVEIVVGDASQQAA